MAKQNDWKPEVSELKLNGSVITADQVASVFIEKNISSLQRENHLILTCGKEKLSGFAGFILFIIYTLTSPTGVFSFRNWEAFLVDEMRNALWTTIENLTKIPQETWIEFAETFIPYGDKDGRARPIKGEWFNFVKKAFSQWADVIRFYKEAAELASINQQINRDKMRVSVIFESLKIVQGLNLVDPEVKTRAVKVIVDKLDLTPSKTTTSEVESAEAEELKATAPVVEEKVEPTEKTQTSEEDTEGTFDD